jgi:hypothetical protein
MSNQDIGNTEDTGTSPSNTQDAGKTYTQEEFDNHMARMKASLTKKLLKPYEDLGDPTELRTLRQQAEQAQTDQAMKRGDFEKVLQDLSAKKDAEIQKRDAMIRDYKLNAPLLETAAKLKAVKPEQVRDLLKSNVTLDENGEPVVVDNQGKIRYSDKGTALSVEDLVQNFLKENPHFVSANPATTNTKSSYTANGSNKVDISSLDLSKPEHRKIYQEARQKGLLKA